jgi:hypothetical protein
MAEPTLNPEAEGPPGGWGSLKGIVSIYGESWPTPAVLQILAHQNKPGGSDSPSERRSLSTARRSGIRSACPRCIP